MKRHVKIWPFEALQEFVGFIPAPPAPDIVASKKNPALAWAIFFGVWSL
jgi:hypothetical protein